jgi:hypothetical protein
LLLALAGCGGDTPGKQASPAAERTVGEVIAARVNGDAITLSEVKRLAERSGLLPKQALERLVGERLLAQHAEERGYGELPSVHIELKRARVRSLLEQVIEPGTGPQQIASERVQETFAAHRHKLPAPQEARIEDHEPSLREYLSNSARRQKLETLLKELRDGTTVVYDEPAIERALAGDGVAGTGT